MTAMTLPSRFPAGTRYVIEGRRGKSGELRIVSRQLILPNGQHIELKAASYDLLWTPTAEVSAATSTRSERKIGLSWFLMDRRGHRMIVHSGGDVGFRSLITLLPDDSLAVVAMSNYDQTPIEGVVYAALDVMMGFEPSVPEPPK